MSFFSNKILQELQQRESEMASSNASIEVDNIEEVRKLVHPKQATEKNEDELVATAF